MRPLNPAGDHYRGRSLAIEGNFRQEYQAVNPTLGPVALRGLRSANCDTLKQHKFSKFTSAGTLTHGDESFLGTSSLRIHSVSILETEPE